MAYDMRKAPGPKAANVQAAIDLWTYWYGLSTEAREIQAPALLELTETFPMGTYLRDFCTELAVAAPAIQEFADQRMQERAQEDAFYEDVEAEQRIADARRELVARDFARFGALSEMSWRGAAQALEHTADPSVYLH